MNLTCIECGATSPEGWGWRAYLTHYAIDDEDEASLTLVAEPGIAVYCLECAVREFDA